MAESRLFRTVVAAVALTGTAGSAWASGYALRELDGASQGESFAGATARADSPATVTFNPAGMVNLRGFDASTTFSAIMPQLELRSASASRAAVFRGPANPITGSLTSDAAGDAVVPALQMSYALTEDIRLGLSVTAPWGLTTKYEATSIVRYHALTSSLQTLNIAPAVAWRVTPQFAIGGAVQFQQADARLSNAVDFGAIGALRRIPGLAPGSYDGRATVQGDDVAIGFQLGALYEPWQGTRFGVNFRSAVFHTLEGDIRFENVPTLLRPAFRDTAARAKLGTPEQLSFGVAQKIDAFTLLADVQWTNWSRFQELRIRADGRADNVTEERWRDAFWISVGANWQPSPEWLLRTGFAWDQSPVPDSTRTPRVPDTDRYWLSFGVTWMPQFLPGMSVSASYTHVMGRDPKVNLVDQGPGTVNFLRGNLSADYRASVDVLTVQARFAF